MRQFKEMKGKDILSNDGRLMGKVEDLTYDADYAPRNLIAKMNKEVIEELGEDKPLLSSLKLGIEVEHVKAFSDKVVLHEPLDELHAHFLEVTDEDMITGIIGKNISGSHGRDVGKIKDVLIDTDHWGMPSLLVKINKDILEVLDVDKPLLSKTKLAISMSHVDSVGDIVILDTSAEEMGQIIQEEPIKKL